MSKYAEIIGGDASDEPRGAVEIAKRALCVFAIIEHSITEHDDHQERLQWLERSGLAAHLSKTEKEYLHTDLPTEQQDIDAGWQAECLVILLWSIGYVSEIPENDVQFEASNTLDFMPGYSDVTADMFIGGAARRPLDELYELARQLQLDHGKAKSRNDHVKVEILQERHRAINWVVGYCGQSWDSVTADT